MIVEWYGIGTDAEDEERAFLAAASKLFGLHSEDGEGRDRSVDAVVIEDAGLVKRRHRNRARRSV